MINDFYLHFLELYMSFSLEEERRPLKSFLTDKDPAAREVAKMILKNPNLTLSKTFKLYREQREAKKKSQKEKPKPHRFP